MENSEDFDDNEESSSDGAHYKNEIDSQAIRE
jgi:hypothetical protein